MTGGRALGCVVSDTVLISINFLRDGGLEGRGGGGDGDGEDEGGLGLWLRLGGWDKVIRLGVRLRVRGSRWARVGAAGRN